ncbi:hypothetical protein [Pseudomonas sp. 3A(2025)]
MQANSQWVKRFSSSILLPDMAIYGEALKPYRAHVSPIFKVTIVRVEKILTQTSRLTAVFEQSIYRRASSKCRLGKTTVNANPGAFCTGSNI